MKKTVIRIASALALVALATPALACGEKEKAQTAASEKASKDATAQKGSAEKPKTAAN